MRIGDLAHETGVSRRLLRYYEEQGLLTPVRSVNGSREYAEADIATVRQIRAMLAAGLPTAVIARVLHCVGGDDELLVPYGCPTVIEDLRRERGLHHRDHLSAPELPGDAGRAPRRGPAAVEAPRRCHEGADGRVP